MGKGATGRKATDKEAREWTGRLGAGGWASEAAGHWLPKLPAMSRHHVRLTLPKTSASGMKLRAKGWAVRA